MTREDFSAALLALGGLDARPFPIERWLELAGYRIRVRLTGNRLADSALRALAHLEVPAAPLAPGELSVSILGYDVPGNPLRAYAGVRRALERDVVERFCFDGVAGRGLLHEGFRALFLLNRVGDRAALWLGDTERFPYHLVTSPLLPILAWFLADRGRPIVHSGAVVTDSGAVLLAGKSGTGKSTASLACLSDGMGLVGDDMCAIQIAPRPVVHSIYCSAKVEAADIGRFPALGGAFASEVHSDADKAVFLFDRYVNHHGAQQIRRRAPIVAIAIPERGSDASPERLTSLQAFLATAPNTVFQMPGLGRESAAGVKALVSAVPAYRVGVGSTIAEIAPRIRAFASSLPLPREAGR